MNEKPAISHDPDCSETRSETYEADGPDGAHYRITRCLDCTGRVVERTVAPAPLIPGTREHEEAWRLHPDRITRQLTLEQRSDPLLNPLHPHARALAPSEQPSVPEALYRWRARWHQ